MTTLIFIVSILMGSSAPTEAHEFHLSRTTINYNSEEKAVQISTSIFIDDLELALKGIGYDSLKICTKREKENAELVILEYLNNHLVVNLSGTDLKWTFIGKEPSDDLEAVWCYLEAYDLEKFDNLSITNTILTSQFDDQKNVTMIQFDKERVAHILFTTDKTFEKVE